MGRRQEHPYFGKPRKSTYRGVSWAKWDAKWQAKLTIDGKQRLLGLFDNEIDAAHARESAEAEYRRAADARVCIDREETAAAIFNAIQAAEHSSEHWKTFSPTQKAAQVAALIRQRPAVRPSVSPDTEAQAREAAEEISSHFGLKFQEASLARATAIILRHVRSRSNAGYEDGVRAAIDVVRATGIDNALPNFTRAGAFKSEVMTALESLSTTTKGSDETE